MIDWRAFEHTVGHSNLAALAAGASAAAETVDEIVAAVAAAEHWGWASCAADNCSASCLAAAN